MVSRDTSMMGMPPLRAIEPMTWYIDETVSNAAAAILRRRMPHRYHLPYYYKSDFNDLQFIAANRLISNRAGVSESILRLVSATFPLMPAGVYKVSYQYVLPGGRQTSSFEFDFTNPVR